MNRQNTLRIPASPMDQFNYALEELGNMSMHFVIEFDECLDTGRLEQAVERVLAMVPVLRSRFVDAPAPYWECISSTSARDIVSIHESTDAARDLQRVLAFAVNPKTHPPLRLDIIRSFGNDTLCISVHHAAMDAYGLIACAEILATCYRNPGLSTGNGPETCPDRSLSAVLSWFKERGHVIMDPPARTPYPDWAFPAPEGGVEEQAFVIRTLPADQLPAIKNTAHRLGATVNDMLIAAFFSALCDYIHPEPGFRVPVLVSIDLRRYLNGKGPGNQSETAQANRTRMAACAREIANLSVAFDVMLPTGTFTFDDRIRQATAEMRAYKEHDPGLSSAIDIESFGYANFEGIRERVQMMKSPAWGSASKTPFLGNIGVIPETAVAFSPGLAVKNAFVAGIVINPPGIALGVTTFRNRMTLSIGYGSAAIPHTVMEGFVDTIISYLSGNRRSGARGCENEPTEKPS